MGLFHNATLSAILNKYFSISTLPVRYDEVVEACALPSDFKQLPAGDQTEVGERGINLSGGQKQRISMARAVYSEADIILLDDPLSAVDALVGQHIFTNCIKDLLDDKTVLFVTHQLQVNSAIFLPECDYVLVMKDGQITEEGTHEKLMNYDGEYFNLIKSFHSSEEQTESLDLSQSDATFREQKVKKEDDIFADMDQYKSLFEKSQNKDSDTIAATKNKKHSSNTTSGKLTQEENIDDDKVDLSTPTKLSASWRRSLCNCTSITFYSHIYSYTDLLQLLAFIVAQRWVWGCLLEPDGGCKWDRDISDCFVKQHIG
ncbi:hypothetical protein EB796_000237 [Bugula neritina]|uniref:ABC transporter domain-containing protein n=1 Tax=Bugula neritina TaxID=10212 RepID=A0A7J7KTP0_BUGNE|nr:hypothetical protein EB796_000237 [Bugula neritina]